MQQYLVRDLMVPFSEYASVRVGTTLLEALRVLERAQEAYSVSKYQHRAIIVLDEDDKVVGKISQLRAVKAIENMGEEGVQALVKVMKSEYKNYNIIVRHVLDRRIY